MLKLAGEIARHLKSRHKLWQLPLWAVLWAAGVGSGIGFVRVTPSTGARSGKETDPVDAVTSARP